MSDKVIIGSGPPSEGTTVTVADLLEVKAMIDRARPTLVCHPDDAGRVTAALRQVSGIPPRIDVSSMVERSHVVVIPGDQKGQASPPARG